MTRILGFARIFASTSCLKKRNVTGGIVSVAADLMALPIELLSGTVPGAGIAAVNEYVPKSRPRFSLLLRVTSRISTSSIISAGFRALLSVIPQVAWMTAPVAPHVVVVRG